MTPSVGVCIHQAENLTHLKRKRNLQISSMALNQLNEVNKICTLPPPRPLHLGHFLFCLVSHLCFFDFKRNDAQVKALDSWGGHSGQASVKKAEQPTLFSLQFTGTVFVQSLMLSTVCRALTHIVVSSLAQTRGSLTPLCQNGDHSCSVSHCFLLLGTLWVFFFAPWYLQPVWVKGSFQFAHLYCIAFSCKNL